MCTPSGLACCPSQFTKLLKPVYATLRQHGCTNFPYIDDSFLMGDTEAECWRNVKDMDQLVQPLGFVLNSEQSCLLPSTTLVFLGFVLNSVSMTITITQEKSLRVKNFFKACPSLLGKIQCKIQ